MPPSTTERSSATSLAAIETGIVFRGPRNTRTYPNDPDERRTTSNEHPFVPETFESKAWHEACFDPTHVDRSAQTLEHCLPIPQRRVRQIQRKKQLEQRSVQPGANARDPGYQGRTQARGCAPANTSPQTPASIWSAPKPRAGQLNRALHSRKAPQTPRALKRTAPPKTTKALPPQSHPTEPTRPSVPKKLKPIAAAESTESSVVAATLIAVPSAAITVAEGASNALLAAGALGASIAGAGAAWVTAHVLSKEEEQDPQDTPHAQRPNAPAVGTSTTSTTAPSIEQLSMENRAPPDSTISL